jgi:hypothetical protein
MALKFGYAGLQAEEASGDKALKNVGGSGVRLLN